MKLVGACIMSAGTRTASTAGIIALSKYFFELLVADDQKAFLVSLSPYLYPFRHLEDFFPSGPSL